MDRYLYYAKKAWEAQERQAWSEAAYFWLIAREHAVCEWDETSAKLKAQWCEERMKSVLPLHF